MLSKYNSVTSSVLTLGHRNSVPFPRLKTSRNAVQSTEYSVRAALHIG